MTDSTIAPANYVAGTWKLDASHSDITFMVRHLVISKVRGSFATFDATVVTAENPLDSTVEATIEVASIDTRNEMRDGHLKSGDFFLAEEFPTATFRSTSVAGTPDDFAVTGDLTLRGVTKSVTLKGEFGGIIVNGYGQTVAALEATTTIDRTDFGVNWNAALEAGGMTLGDDVKLEFHLELVLEQPEA